MRELLNPRMRGTLRHLLTSIGPLLAAYGVAEDSTWQLWVGLLMAGLGFYDSWTAPEKKQVKTTE